MEKLAYNLSVKPLVYIETSIPSFYYEVRTEAGMVARRQWTRQWWDELRHEYALATSIAVLDELGAGDYPGKDEALNLVKDVLLVYTARDVWRGPK